MLRRDWSSDVCSSDLIAAWMVSANLAVDLAYGWLDPRVRGAAAGGH
jgi:ABC-type dipeptide/oligopeptide/nickel transport system permease component